MPEIEKLTLNDPETQSADIVAGNLAALQALFPEAFSEGRIDFEGLKQALGGAVDDREDKYGLNWHGKRRARQIALTPSTGTLLPCPQDSLDWDTTQNLMIEGDNLEVLKLLQKSYAGKVKLIYIDPPYNTGRDFVYPDDFRDSIKNYLELTGQAAGGSQNTSNPDSSGRFHTDWMNMIYPRLKLARNLLRDDGVIFISIDDTEVANLRIVCGEIFGEENFLANIIWQKRYGVSADAKGIPGMHDHILCFSKSANFVPGLLPRTGKQDDIYKNLDNDPRGLWRPDNLTRSEYRERDVFPIVSPTSGESFYPPKGSSWRHPEAAILEMIRDNRIWFGKDGRGRPAAKRFLTEVKQGVVASAWWPYSEVGHTDESKKEVQKLFEGVSPFDTPKPTRLIRRMIEIGASDKNDIILDFFAGSGTSGDATLKANAADDGNRRYILVQLPEVLSVDEKEQRLAADFCTSIGVPLNIAELTKERLRRAGQKVKSENSLFVGDTGFRVYKLASSNIRAWEPVAADLENTLLTHAEHLVPGRTEADILTELLLKLGLDLCVPIEQKQIAGKAVHSIGAGALIACLSDGITRDVAEELGTGIAAWRKALNPAVDTRVVLKDSGFADNDAKLNMAAILTQAGITDMRSL